MKTKKWEQVGVAWWSEQRGSMTVVLDAPVGGKIHLFTNDRRERELERAVAKGHDTTGIERWPTHRAMVPNPDFEPQGSDPARESRKQFAEKLAVVGGSR